MTTAPGHSDNPKSAGGGGAMSAELQLRIEHLEADLDRLYEVVAQLGLSASGAARRPSYASAPTTPTDPHAAPGADQDQR
jgi:hypothetical protein